MSITWCQLPLLFVLCAFGIRRHPGSDESKSEILSDVLRAKKMSRDQVKFSSQMSRLLQEWEAGMWSSANYTAVIASIEDQIILEIQKQHTIQQQSLNVRMNELACKSTLVENAWRAANKADLSANAAMVNERAKAVELTNSMQKLKNLDLMRYRSVNTVETTKTFSRGELMQGLDSFSCDFSVGSECDTEFSTYSSAVNDDIVALEAELKLENSTWNGFLAEKTSLDAEVASAESAASAAYDGWSQANAATRDAWRLREHHVCREVKTLSGVALTNSDSYYGLPTYVESAVLQGQTCTENPQVPISYQRQHADFCQLHWSLSNSQSELSSANRTGSQVDQDYELEVLDTILCILKKLDAQDQNSTSDTSSMVDECENAERVHSVGVYEYDATGASCIASFLADKEPVDQWCFAGLNFQDTITQQSLSAFTMRSDSTVPSCGAVTAGSGSLTFSNQLEYRLTSFLNNGPFAGGHWDDKTMPADGISGHSFLEEAQQDQENVWASWYQTNSQTGIQEFVKCVFQNARAKQETGYESQLTGITWDKCALPSVDQYKSESNVNYKLVPGTTDTANWHHYDREYINQCGAETR